MTDGKKEILLAMSGGMGIRFKEDDIRPMGLVAAGVNGVKLGVGDEVVGAVLLPGEGEVMVIASDGKAKRLEQSEIPSQGRYGRGVILWDMATGVKLVGLALGKGTHVITLHLLKAAPKMTRLDEAGVKKRATVRGDVVVEVKPGDAVLGVTDVWMVEQFVVVELKAEKPPRAEKAAPTAQKKPTTTKAPPAVAPKATKAVQGQMKLDIETKAKKPPAKK